ncbi:MAG: RNA methyltransferase [Eubacteriales bacterium]|nr:RNA methyltransferase [Eubacteriales bacterium]
MIQYIKSTENRIIKLVKHLSKKGERDKNSLFIAEGVRLVREAIADGKPEFILTTSPCKDFVGTQYIVSDELFEKLSDTRTPQGIMALCPMPRWDEGILCSARLVLVCENISDPGNLGTMLRTAEAAGADAVILAGNTVDLYNPKTVRSTMGSVFRVPVFVGDTYVDKLGEYGFTLAVTCLDGAIDLYKAETVGKKVALAIGSEAHGISKALENKADLKIKIPMWGKVESLNAAIAASVCLYECRRRLESQE